MSGKKAAVDSVLTLYGYAQIRKIGEGSFGAVLLVENVSKESRGAAGLEALARGLLPAVIHDPFLLQPGCVLNSTRRAERRAGCVMTSTPVRALQLQRLNASTSHPNTRALRPALCGARPNSML